MMLSEHASEDCRRLNPHLDPAKLAAKFDAASEAKSEAELHDQISAMLRRNGVEYVGHGSMAHKTKYTIGWPDYVIPLTNGRVLFWEIKFGAKKPRPEQVTILNWLTNNGHHATVIRSYNQALVEFQKQMLFQ